MVGGRSRFLANFLPASIAGRAYPAPVAKSKWGLGIAALVAGLLALTVAVLLVLGLGLA